MEYNKFPEVDHFVLNEAEEPLKPFLRDLEESQAERVYASDQLPDLQQTPVLHGHLANLKHYISISIQFSRVCHFSCDFCSVTTLLGHRPRTRTAAQIIAEMDSFYVLDWRQSVFFVQVRTLRPFRRWQDM